MTGPLPQFHEVEPPVASVEDDAATRLDDELFSAEPDDGSAAEAACADVEQAGHAGEPADDPDFGHHVGFEFPALVSATEPPRQTWFTAVAWAGSILAHAAIASVAVLAAREVAWQAPAASHTPPRFQFALGDTAEEHGVRNHNGADALPGVVGAAGSAIAPDAGAAAAEPEPEQPAVAALPPTPQSIIEPEPSVEGGALPIVPPSAAQAKMLDIPVRPNKLDLPSETPAVADASANGAAATGAASESAKPASATIHGSGQAAGHSPVASIAGQNGTTTGDGGAAISGVPGIRAGLRNGRKLITPTYPYACRQAGEEGLVRLMVDVRADGTIAKISVIDDAGHPRLAQAAVRSLDGFVFDPALDDSGHPVPDSLPIPYAFRLQNARR